MSPDFTNLDHIPKKTRVFETTYLDFRPCDPGDQVYPKVFNFEYIFEDMYFSVSFYIYPETKVLKNILSSSSTIWVNKIKTKEPRGE
jgi:hypothetical protein